MMTPFKRFHLVRTLYRSSQIGESSSYLLGSSKTYSSAISNGSEGNFRSFYPNLLKGQDGFPFAGVKSLSLRSTMAAEWSIFMNDKRMITTHAKAPAQARQVAQQISLSSPGFIYEPYEPRAKMPFWKRWFTRSGWRRTKHDIILELKSAYAIAKLRKKGYSKKQFYNEAVNMYKEINTLIANGDRRSLRKSVTEKMFSALKNEIKQRESAWSKVYWEMVEPVVTIRTLRARLIGVDRKDLDKTFIQLTLEILAKQKFEAYDTKGSVVAGDKSKEEMTNRFSKGNFKLLRIHPFDFQNQLLTQVLVRDIWVFEKSMFHRGASWRLCGRITPKKASHSSST